MPRRVKIETSSGALACSLRSNVRNMLRRMLFIFCPVVRITSGFVAVPVLLSAFLTFSTAAHAQSDPYGSVDSVIVGSSVTAPGAKFSVSVLIVNDEALGGYAIPLQYPKDLLIYDSASFNNSRVINWGFRSATHDAAAGTILAGGVALGDAPIMAGRGPIVELFFTVKSGLTQDVIAQIDSTFVPPAAHLELSPSNGGVIYPHFGAGKITITAADQAPVFVPVTARTVSEGTTLTIPFSAHDPERAPVKLYAGRLSPGAQFEDNGNGSGSLTWKVPYVGNGSCTGSPYVITIFATDGVKRSSIDVPITVTNNNRLPVITAAAGSSAGAGDTLLLPFAAVDPDFEAVSFSATGLPSGAQLSTSNPGLLTWSSDIADSGDYAFTLTAKDESGGESSQQVNFTLLPTMPIELSISNEQAFGGEIVTVAISLRNRVDISGFNVTIGFDNSALAYLSTTKTGTRAANWPQYQVTTGADKVFINARSSTTNPPSNLLAEGTGPVAFIRFLISSNTNFAGLFTGMEFTFISQIGADENIAFDNTGAAIVRAQTLYSPGGVLIQKYNGKIGDINLNGIAFEIGDIVYFSNYFINPVAYPLDGPRLQNSDVNQDGTPGTLSDLVRLIQIVSGGSSKNLVDEPSAEVSYSLTRGDSGSRLTLNTAASFAAARFVFSAVSDGDQAISAQNDDRWSFTTHTAGGTIVALLLSRDGRDISVASGELLAITAPSCELIETEFIASSGQSIAASNRGAVVLPLEFELSQNFPNPFNPSTEIAFALPEPSHVELRVFNVLGETVAIPFQGALPAGHHRVTFDSGGGAPLPSGIYFYRLNAGNFGATKKMVLLK